MSGSSAQPDNVWGDQLFFTAGEQGQRCQLAPGDSKDALPTLKSPVPRCLSQAALTERVKVRWEQILGLKSCHKAQVFLQLGDQPAL